MKSLQNVAFNYVTSAKSIEGLPQFVLWMSRECGFALKDEIEGFLTTSYIFEHMYRCAGTSFSLPTNLHTSHTVFTFGYGACGHMYCTDSELYISINITKGDERNIALTCLVLFEALKRLYSQKAEECVVPFELQCIFANQSRGYSLSGSVTAGSEWFKKGVFSSPKVMARMIRNAMHETWVHVMGAQVFTAQDLFDAEVLENGRFFMVFTYGDKKNSVYNFDPIDSEGRMQFASSYIHGPVELVVLLAGVATLCSFA